MSSRQTSSPDALEAALKANFPDLIFVLDEQNIFRAYHAAESDDLLLPPERFLEKKAPEVLPDELWSQFETPLASVRSSNQPQSARYALLTQKGEKFYEARLTPAGGGVVLVQVCNITTQHLLDIQLRKQLILLEELRKLHMIATSGEAPERVFQELLRSALRATDCSCGFLWEVTHEHQKQGTSGVLCGVAFDEKAETTQARRTQALSVAEGHFQAMFSGAPLAQDLLAKGAAWVPVVTPLFQGGQPVGGLVLLASRSEQRAPDLKPLLEPILTSCVHLISFYQNERARQSAEQERSQATRVFERFRRLFEVSNVCVCVLSFDGTIVDANPAFLQALAWGEDELSGESISRIFHPDDLENIQVKLDRLIEGHTVEGVKIRLIQRNGGYRWMLLNGIRDPDQSLLFLVSIDIHEQKLREQKELEQLRLLEMSEQLSGVGHWRMEIPEMTLRWSAEVCRIHGVEPGYTPSLAELPSLLHPEDGPNTLQRIREACSARDEFFLEFRILRRGEVRRVHMLGRPEMDAAGKLSAYFGVFRDITEQWLTEMELYKLATVANRTNNAVVITDKNGVIEWVNDGFERLTGYSLSDCAGWTPGGLLQGPASDPATIAVMRQKIREQQGFQVEIVNYNRSGKPYWVQIDVQPVFDTNAQLSNFIAILTDTSQHKHFEEQLKITHEEALKVSRLKSQFLANMSHEIRTPLNGILGMTELLMQVISDESLRGQVQIIRDSGQILLATINDILDFSKIEAGKIDLADVPFSLPAITKDTVRFFTAEAREKGISLFFEPAPNLPEIWVGDPIRLRQILFNLIGNAMKFTGKGSITVRFAPGGDGGLLGEVSDTGPGVPLELRKSIFEPFVQADGSATRTHGGSGLGLAICRDLLSRMGGQIWYEDAPGGGARFLFTARLKLGADQAPTPLPLLRGSSLALRPSRPKSSPSAAPPGQETPAQEPSRGLCLLLVEDNEVNAKITRKLLEKEGHSVVLACNGLEALEQWRQQAFDLILMDVQMPVLDGLEATRKLRQEETFRSKKTPILALTANAMKGDKEACLQAGMDGYLTKPVSRETLLHAIQRVLDDHKKSFDMTVG